MRNYSKGLLLFSIALLCYLFFPDRKHFSLQKISSCLPFSPLWETAPPTKQEKEFLKELCIKPFEYLGEGAECYAFVSHDGAHVLKFFKMKHLTPKNWLRYLPFSLFEKYRLQKIDRRILRQKQLFVNYKAAYETLREETGLILIHLNKTKDFLPSTLLLDKRGRKHRIDLDRFEFVIQQKATLVQEHIAQLMRQGDVRRAKQALVSLLEHIRLQCSRGFIDGDSGINHNYGFVEDRVIHFDIGRLTYDESGEKASQGELLRVVKKLESFLETSYPELLPLSQHL